MRKEDGVYSVNTIVGVDSGKTLTARSIFLVEDKARSFEGLPHDCAGAFIRRAGRAASSQLGSLPEHVITAPDLAVVTRRIYQSAAH